MKFVTPAKLLGTLLLSAATAVCAQSNDVGASVSGTSPAPVGPAAVTATGTLDGTEATAVARLFRDAIASTCSPAKTYPGQFGGGNAYRPHTLYNNGAAQCVTVNFDVGTCGTGVHLTAYAGSFDPSNLATNYLGDVGSSITQSFSFMAPASSAVVLVAFDNGGTAARCTYGYSSNELSATAGSTTSIPTVSEWGMMIMASFMVLGAVVAMRRKQD